MIASGSTMRPRPRIPLASRPSSGPTMVMPRSRSDRQVGLGGGVLEHEGVHGRRQQHGRLCGEHGQAEEVVGEAVRQPGERRRACRRDDDGIGATPQLDVGDRQVAGRREDVGVDGPAAQPLERDRRDEAGARLRQDDVDQRAGLRELADEVGALVSGDAARDADDDALAFEHSVSLLGGRRGLAAVGLLNEAQPDEREVDVHFLDDRRLAGDERRVAAGRDDLQRRPRAPSSCGR